MAKIIDTWDIIGYLLGEKIWSASVVSYRMVDCVMPFKHTMHTGVPRRIKKIGPRSLTADRTNGRYTNQAVKPIN